MAKSFLRKIILEEIKNILEEQRYYDAPTTIKSRVKGQKYGGKFNECKGIENVKYGCKGQDVMKLQNFLNQEIQSNKEKYPISAINPDGYFSDTTESALKMYAGVNNIKLTKDQDGKVLVPGEIIDSLYSSSVKDEWRKPWPKEKEKLEKPMNFKLSDNP